MKIIFSERDSSMLKSLKYILCMIIFATGITSVAYYITDMKLDRKWKRMVKSKNERIIKLKCIPVRDHFGYTYEQLEALASEGSLCEFFKKVFPGKDRSEKQKHRL